MDTTIVRANAPEVVAAGDPFYTAARGRKRRVLLALDVISESCAYCGYEESGLGDQGELCVSCAAEFGALTARR